MAVDKLSFPWRLASRLTAFRSPAGPSQGAETTFSESVSATAMVGAVEQDIWLAGGIRVLPAVAAVPVLVSTSAADAAAGVGARSVLVRGLDPARAVIEDSIELDGLNPVLLPRPYSRINDLQVASAGATRRVQGTVTATIGGLLQAQAVPDTVDPSQQGAQHLTSWSVPTESVALIREIAVTVGRDGLVDMWLVQRLANGAEFTLWAVTLAGPIVHRCTDLPTRRSSSACDLFLRARATGGDAAVSAAMSLDVIRNRTL